jgi:fermentation-respiration switch protein FrsA (DUF1100 family)
VLVGLQRRLIYLPFPAQVPPAEAVVPGAREVRLRTVDGLALGAWLVEAGEPERGVAVLVANGNAGNRSLRAPLARALASAGLAVLLFDYRGYGGNPGRPSEQGLARDVRAAHRFLIEEAEVAPARLLYYGKFEPYTIARVPDRRSRSSLASQGKRCYLVLHGSG